MPDFVTSPTHRHDQSSRPTRALAASPAWRRLRLAVIGSTSGTALLLLHSQAAQAAPPAFVNVCTGLGVNLPALQPVASATSGLLTGLLTPVNGVLDGVVGSVNTNLTQALSGKPIGVGVLDSSTNSFVNVPSSQCNLTASGYQLDNNLGLSMGGGQIVGLGGTGNATATAGDATAIALGNGAATGLGVVNAVALGTGAVTTAANSVALGAGTIAARGATAGYTAFGLAAPQTSVGEVSVGSPTGLRQVTNVAAGSFDTDAATVGQLRGSISPLQAASKLAVSYQADGSGNPVPSIDLRSNPNLPGITTQVNLTGVAPGTLAAHSVDAVNGAQLFETGSSTAAALGGGATLNTATGTISAPAYAIRGTIYNSVGTALSAVDSALDTVASAGPVQYSTVGAPTTANPGVISNDVTLVGTNAAPVALHNVAAGAIGAGRTDAANTGQLYAGNQSIATIIGGGATYNVTTGTVTNPSFTINGSAYTTIGGALDALAGSIGGLGNQKYFQANSTLGNAQATAANSVAVGPVAVASAANAVAIGNGATASGTNSVALGSGSTDGGLANVVSVGAVGAERRITNLAAGTLAAGSTDAVNGGQLYQTNQQIASLGHASVQYDTTGTGTTLSSVTLSSDQGGPVVIHNLAPGVATSDAATVGQVQNATANSVQYTTVNGVKTNLISLQGGSTGPVTITNLAAGVNPTDAVNVAQLQAATAGFGSLSQAYTDQQVGNLKAYTDRELDKARKNAAGGTALALAATGLRYEDRPGKVSLAGATSYYHDQMGIAVGLGATSEDGRIRVNAALTASPTMPSPDIGAVVGASIGLN